MTLRSMDFESIASAIPPPEPTAQLILAIYKGKIKEDDTRMGIMK